MSYPDFSVTAVVVSEIVGVVADVVVASAVASDSLDRAVVVTVVSGAFVVEATVVAAVVVVFAVSVVVAAVIAVVESLSASSELRIVVVGSISGATSAAADESSDVGQGQDEEAVVCCG